MVPGIRVVPGKYLQNEFLQKQVLIMNEYQSVQIQLERNPDNSIRFSI